MLVTIRLHVGPWRSKADPYKKGVSTLIVEKEKSWSKEREGLIRKIENLQKELALKNVKIATLENDALKKKIVDFSGGTSRKPLGILSNY